MVLLLTINKKRFTDYTCKFVELIDIVTGLVKENLKNISVETPSYVKAEIKRYITGIRWPARRMEYSFVLRALDLFFKSSGIKNILDVGSGPSAFPSILESRFDCAIRCIDRDEDMLNAMKRIELPGCSYTLSDMESLPFKEESFDVITCVSVLEHVPRAEGIGAVTEMLRVVNKNGLILLTIDYRSLSFFSSIQKWLIRFYKAFAFLLKGKGGDIVKAVSSPNPYNWKELKEFYLHFKDYIIGMPNRDWANMNLKDLKKFWAIHRQPEFQYDPKNRDYTSIGILMASSPDVRAIFSDLKSLHP